MQGCSGINKFLLVISIALVLLAATDGPVRADEASPVLGSGLHGAAGLALDPRGYAYTLAPDAGTVLCIPPGGNPMVYARVANPTALAVDRLRTLFVGTASGTIFAVTPDGLASRVHECGSRVAGLSLDRDGNLLVVTGKGAILRLERGKLRFSD